MLSHFSASLKIVILISLGFLLYEAGTPPPHQEQILDTLLLCKTSEKTRENWLKDKCEEIESLEREGKFEMMLKRYCEPVY